MYSVVGALNFWVGTDMPYRRNTCCCVISDDDELVKVCELHALWLDESLAAQHPPAPEGWKAELSTLRNGLMTAHGYLEEPSMRSQESTFVYDLVNGAIKIVDRLLSAAPEAERKL